jgi:hypothetical protein
VTVGEVDDFPLFFVHRLNRRVPVLLIDGQLDELFCGSQYGGANCSSAAALVAQERSHLGPHVPLVDGYVLPNAGHDLNTALDAQQYFDEVQNWITAHVGGSG